MAVDIGGLISVLIFYAILLLVGIWAAKKSRKSDTKDRITAGRNLSLGVGVFTLTATWIGGGYVNGAAEIIFTKGVIWCQTSFGYSMSLIVAGIFFAKQAREKNYVTMLDPLQEAFGLQMGTLLYIPVFIGEVFWCSTTLSSLGTSLSILLSWNSVVAIIVSTMLATVYTLIGGLWAVAYTDIIQLIISFLGLYLCIPFAWTHRSFDRNISSEWLGTIESQYIPMYIDLLLMIIFGGIPWQAFYQRILATRSPDEARKISILSGLCCFIFAIPAIVLGIVGREADWSKTTYKGTVPIPNEEAKFILPLILVHMTPYFVSILAIGAISAAIISSADSSILGASSLFTWNMYKRTLRPKASENEIKWANRISIVAIGLIAAGVAIKADTIYGLVYLCSDLIYVILFPQLLGVTHFPSYCNVYGSLSGYIVAGFLRVGAGEKLLNIPPLIKYPGFSQKLDEQLFPFRTFAMLCGMVALVFFSVLAEWLFRKEILHAKWNILNCDFQRLVKIESSRSESLEGEEESKTMLSRVEDEVPEVKAIYVHSICENGVNRIQNDLIERTSIKSPKQDVT